MEIRKTFRFEASHVLPKHPGKCSRLHGHSWVLHVAVEGPVNRETGFVMDYADLSEKVKPLIDELDHRHLGQWAEWVSASEPLKYGPIASAWLTKWAPPLWHSLFYPSSENLLMWLGHELLRVGLDWSTLSLEETCTSSATLRRAEFNDILNREESSLESYRR